MHRAALPIIALAASLAASAPASAHAFLKSATPPVGSTVPAAPAQVVIDYTEGVEPRFSTIEVQNAAGKRVDKGDVHVAPGNNERLAVSLNPLPPGTYKTTWHATAVDTHKTEGSFVFTVAP
jgi:methionine-rich copper-binding protein CopC